jgi:hypothetical protein
MFVSHVYKILKYISQSKYHFTGGAVSSKIKELVLQRVKYNSSLHTKQN